MINKLHRRITFNATIGFLTMFVFIGLIPLYHFTVPNVLVSLGMFYFFTNIVHSLFLHRWAAHNLWTPPVWMQYVISWIGTSTMFQTPVGWGIVHRLHHMTSDTDEDPHSPFHKSPFYIIFTYRFSIPTIEQIRIGNDRLRVPFFWFLEAHQGFIILLTNLSLYGIMGLENFLTWWVVPSIVSIVWSVWTVEGTVHRTGKPENIWWTFFLIFDDFNHADHHDKPSLTHWKYDIGHLVRFLGWENK